MQDDSNGNEGKLFDEYYSPIVDSDEVIDLSGTNEYVDNLSFDPRMDALGLRMYTFNHQQSFAAEDMEERPKEYYDLMRYCFQIPEFEENFQNPPHKSNMDFIGSLDLRKGCFLGQELTARTSYNGVRFDV